jgi:hypothetical protein
MRMPPHLRIGWPTCTNDIELNNNIILRMKFSWKNQTQEISAAFIAENG